jgi:DNA-damage-inducible protein J
MCYIVAQEDFVMTANSVVRARIDEQIKNEAAAVLKAMGLTVSDAFRLMMVKIAKEKALPFEPLVPNDETIEAMKAARRGELTTVGPPGKLLASLNEDC